MEKKYNFLRPIKNKNLIRLGRKADGGYVVDKNVVQNTDYLVTFGLGPDWTFELDYIKINQNLKITMVHGSKDNSVPVVYSKKILKIFKTGKKKIVIIKNGDHSLSSPKWLKILKKELKLIIN